MPPTAVLEQYQSTVTIDKQTQTAEPAPQTHEAARSRPEPRAEGFLKRIQNSLRENGLLTVAANTLVRLIPAWLLRLYVLQLFELRLRPELLNTKHLCDAREANAADLDLLAPFMDRDQVLKRFQQGHRLFIALIDGHYVGRLWSAAKQYDEPDFGLRYEFPSDLCWIYSASIEEGYRGKRIYTTLLHTTLQALARDGGERVSFVISRFNRNSRKAHFREGATVLKTVVILRVLGTILCGSWGKGISTFRLRAGLGRKLLLMPTGK